MNNQNVPVMRAPSADGLGHAVVIGGSMAGLLAARALADHFARVTIIERDAYADAPAQRRGVPQGHHLHVLLARGLEIVEELFPGLRAELIAAGSPTVDTGADLAWLTPAGWGKPFPSGLTIQSFTRPLLDHVVRRRLADVRNVRFVNECEVSGLLPDAAGAGVRGVAVRQRGCAERITPTHGVAAVFEEPLHADLVVDASGRGSRAPEWLAALGYAPPRETTVNAFLGYASRLYAPPAGFAADWRAIFLQAAPPENVRAAVLFPVEGDRWMLTLTGGARDYPPTDEAGFLDFARNLPSTLVYEAIKDATPLTPVRSYRATENRLRHYEELARFPEHFVVLGDAACAFNPVYGQGMTIAALGALELSHCLRAGGRGRMRAGFARRFQRRLARINSLPWALATGEDCRYRGTTGAPLSVGTRLMQRYTGKVVALTTGDVGVRLLWLEVFQMLKPPGALFHPAVVAKVLFKRATTPQAFTRAAARKTADYRFAGATCSSTDEEAF